MRPLNHIEKNTIKGYIKNKLDISNIIKDKDIKGEDFSRAIIKSFSWTNTDISNCNFTNTEFGSEGQRNSFLSTILDNCNFKNAKFNGQVWMRNCKARNCNFTGANLATLEYQNTDFSKSSFCGAIIKITAKLGIGAIFPPEMFYDL